MCVVPRGGAAPRIFKPGRHLVYKGSYENQFACPEGDNILRDFKPVYAINVKSKVSYG